MQAIALQAASRTITGRQAHTLRAFGKIPAVIYGKGISSANLELDYNTFIKTFKAAGATNLVDLAVDGKTPVKVLIHDIARDPVSYRINHVDFYAVNMSEKLTADIPLKFVGESAAVKELGGILVKTINAVEVSGLPSDLVPEIEVSIAPLKTFDDSLHMHDIKLPKGLTITSKTNDVIAKVMPPRSDEEIASLSAAVEEKIDSVERVQKPEKPAEDDAAAAATKAKA